MPCRGDVCALLDHDPVNQALPLPLSHLGLLYGICLLVLALLFAAGRGKPFGAACYWLNAAGALVGLGLVVYGYHKTGGFCPWCTASASCSLAGFTALSFSGESGQGLKSASLIIVAGALSSAIVIALVDRDLRTPHIDLEAAARISPGMVWREGLALSRGGMAEERPRYVVFVDLACGTCRRLLERLRGSSARFGVRICFVEPVTSYSGYCAGMLAANRDAPGYDELWSLILEDDSRTIDSVQDWAAKHQDMLTTSQASSGSLSTSLARSLGIVSTPTVVSVDGPRLLAVPVADLRLGLR